MAEPRDAAMVAWRSAASQMARRLEAAAALGGITLAPAVAQLIAAMLIEAEPPGTAAHQIGLGYAAGLAAAADKGDW